MNNSSMKNLKKQIAKTELAIAENKTNLRTRLYFFEQTLVSSPKYFIAAFLGGLGVGLKLAKRKKIKVVHTSPTTASENHNSFSALLINLASIISTLFSAKQFITKLLTPTPKNNNVSI